MQKQKAKRKAKEIVSKKVEKVEKVEKANKPAPRKDNIRVAVRSAEFQILLENDEFDSAITLADKDITCIDNSRLYVENSQTYGSPLLKLLSIDPQNDPYTFRVLNILKQTGGLKTEAFYGETREGNALTRLYRIWAPDGQTQFQRFGHKMKDFDWNRRLDSRLNVNNYGATVLESTLMITTHPRENRSLTVLELIQLDKECAKLVPLMSDDALNGNAQTELHFAMNLAVRHLHVATVRALLERVPGIDIVSGSVWEKFGSLWYLYRATNETCTKEIFRCKNQLFRWWGNQNRGGNLIEAKAKASLIIGMLNAARKWVDKYHKAIYDMLSNDLGLVDVNLLIIQYLHEQYRPLPSGGNEQENVCTETDHDKLVNNDE